MKEVIYPIFFETMQYSSDSFWIYLFENLAYGICPDGVYFQSENTISCKYKGKEFNFDFSQLNAKDIFDKLKNILQTKCNIYSKNDCMIQTEKLTDMLSKYKEQNWNQLKKKSIKEGLIENYVIELKNKHKFSNIIMKKLYYNIMLAINLKLISQQDICYDIEQGKIMDIKGLLIENNKIKFNTDTIIYFEPNNTFEEIEKYNPIDLIDIWNKYCYNIY